MKKRSDDSASISFEAVKPIPVVSPSIHPIRFWLRCLIDLQLATIVAQLRPELYKSSGDVLDVGAGNSPWRSWLPATAHYQGLDIANSAEFGMVPCPADVIYYDGNVFPFDSARFDSVFCIEVLEHAQNPELMVAEMARVLREDGRLVLSVPWSARCHHQPYDFHRFSRYRLADLLEENGFRDVQVVERGNDICTIANKLTVFSVGLVRGGRGSFSSALVAVVFFFPAVFLASVFSVAAQLSLFFRFGRKDDPLGYFVRARKSS